MIYYNKIRGVFMIQSQDNNYITQYQYKKNILNSIDELINYYTSKHRKAMLIRFDLHYPFDYLGNTDTNQHISRCMTKIRQKYQRQNLDPEYIWTREQGTSKHPHYHCAIMLNASKVLAYNHVFKNSEELWKSTIGTSADGLVNHCMKSKDGTPHENGIYLDRSNPNYHSRLQDVYRQTSYIAKANDKGGYKDGLRDYGMSRITTKISNTERD
jgi:hypothetical protein